MGFPKRGRPRRRVVNRRRVFSRTRATVDLTVAATIAQPTLAVTLSGFNDSDLTAAGTIPQPILAVDLSVSPLIVELDVAGTIPAPVLALALAGFHASALSLAATIPAPLLAVDLETLPALRVAATIPQPILDVDLTSGDNVDVDGLIPLPVLEVDLSVRAIIHTQTWNRAGGRTRHARATLDWDPPITATPETALGVDAPFARIYNNLTIDTDGNSRYDSGAETYAYGPMLDFQLIVNGRDVTTWRNARTPLPDFEFDSPLGYGPAIWTFEGIGPHEMMPRWEGDDDSNVSPDLADWCFPDAHAKVKVYDVATGIAIPALTWHGLLDDFVEDGNNLKVIASGWWSGQASMRDLQLPLFAARADVRHLLRHLAEGIPGVQLEGDDTGIIIQRFGGMRHLAAINQLLTAQTRTKGPFTILPEWGTRRFSLTEKSTETIDATFYGDGKTMRLERDRVNEPDRIFGYGVTPAGQRVRNGRYPGVLDDPDEAIEQPDFPIEGGTPFGYDPDDPITNADTVHGDGITVLQVRLQTYGFLSKDDVTDESGVFGLATEAAVNRLRFQADILPLTGMVSENVWDALFSIGRIGSSIWWSKVEPMAQKPWTKKWKYSADGSILGKRDGYEGDTRRMVDKTNNYGSGWRRGQMFDFSDKDLDDSEGPIVFGELDLDDAGGLLRGSVDPGTSLTDADFMHQLEVRPGMNIRLPYTRWGDIVVQVATVPVRGGKVTAKVSTRPIDSIPLWEKLNANRERQRDTASVFWHQSRSSGKVIDTVTEFDEIGGQINPVKAIGGQYRVFRVLAGQIGMIEKYRLRTSPHREFVTAIFGLPISPAKLAEVCPNPLADKQGWIDSMNELNADFRLLYIAGEPGDPGGFSPGRKSEGHALTGEFEDASGFPFKTSTPEKFAPWVYVAFYAANDCLVHGGNEGRILWNQELVGL